MLRGSTMFILFYASLCSYVSSLLVNKLTYVTFEQNAVTQTISLPYCHF